MEYTHSTYLVFGGGGGVGVVNFGVIVVREPEFRKLNPIHMPGFWKNGPIHILDRPECWPIHILPFDFYTYLLLVVGQISQSIHWIPKEQAASKNLWAKNICIYRDVRKAGPFTYESRKIRPAIILFVEKRGLIMYLTALKKGAIRHAHP